MVKVGIMSMSVESFCCRELKNLLMDSDVSRSSCLAKSIAKKIAQCFVGFVVEVSLLMESMNFEMSSVSEWQLSDIVLSIEDRRT